MQGRYALRLVTGLLATTTFACVTLAQHPTRPRPPARPPGPAQPTQQQPQSPPVLRINGQEVTQEEVTRFAWTRMGKRIILDVIDETLIIQAAHRAGIVVTEAEINKRIDELAAIAGGIEKVVAKRGVAGVEALRAQVKAELLLAKLVEAAGKITDAQARAYYQTHKDEFTTPTRLHLYEIVTDKDETAYNARARLAQGEPFAKVAAEVSIAPSAQRGGEAGWVTLEQIQPEVLRRTVATLQVGQVSMPVFIKGKFHIIMVTEKQAGTVKPFEEVKKDIIDKLRARRGATPRGVLMKLRRAAAVEVLVPPYKYLEQELAELKRIKVVVNGQRLELKQPAVKLASGRIIVPAKPVFKALGCRVEWVAGPKMLVVTRGDRSVRAKVGSDEAVADGETIKLGEKVQMRNGAVWAPPRGIAQALGCKVVWDPVEYVLSLSAPAAGD